jgi:hypothetical protein
MLWAQGVMTPYLGICRNNMFSMYSLSFSGNHYSF